MLDSNGSASGVALPPGFPAAIPGATVSSLGVFGWSVGVAPGIGCVS